MLTAEEFERLFKLAHQFWISYPPPGAGSSTSSKEKEKQIQLEEEKRGSTREQRQLDYDAAVKVKNYVNIIYNIYIPPSTTFHDRSKKKFSLQI